MLIVITHLIQIVTSLRQMVIHHLAAPPHAPLVVLLGHRFFVSAPPPNLPARLPAETWLLYRTRLGRLAERIRALFDRWQAGTLPPPRPRHPRRATGPHPRPGARLPTGFAWARPHLATCAPLAGQLDYHLQRDHLRHFVAEVPRAGRLLRPLCRALGIHPPAWLALPPRPRKPRPARAPRAAPPATRDRPLQPHVRAAARAWKKPGE